MMQAQTTFIFTDEAMNRPLFEEPTPDIERDDPFSGPQGFMLGDEFIPTLPELSQQYFDAAHLLVESIKRQQWEDYKLVHPALFLYRHAIELQLKSLIGDGMKGHDLLELFQSMAAYSERIWGIAAVPAWIEKRIRELSAVDPRSTAFRYGTVFNPETKRDEPPVPSAMYICLPHLQRAMLTLMAALRGAMPEVTRWHPVQYPIDETDY